MTKKQRETLAYLGEPYRLQRIDLEDCIYRDLGNGYDIEVSGLRKPMKRGTYCNFVCVWDVSHGKNQAARSVEYVRDIKSLEHLKLVLDDLVEKYTML